MNTFLKSLLLFFILSFTNINAQTNIKDYEHQWEGKLNDKNTFNFYVTVKALDDNQFQFSLFNKNFNFSKKIVSTENDYIALKVDDNISFSGRFNKKRTEISGFISSGFYFYHTKLVKDKDNRFRGKWNVFMLDELLSNYIFLSIENVTDTRFDAFPFFGDQRFSGTFAMNAKQNGNTITFFDVRTGVHFRGTLLKYTIELEMLIANTVFSKVSLSKTKTPWKFGDYMIDNNTTINLNDGWVVKPIQKTKLLQQMEDSIIQNKLINTHSVLIAKKGKIIYEKYFKGFTGTTPHDQRSASKSVASAITGIAIQEGLLKSDADLLYNYIPKEYQYTKDSLKSQIKIKDLLTMSSGLDAVDFGIKRKSKASEQAYQNSPNWLKTVLETPMIYQPGTVANYGSANPFLLGEILKNLTPIPLRLYLDEKIFQPLGIHNYVIQKGITGDSYFGGGMYITPRDMLKFGQLYLNKGKFDEKRIVSKKWVKKSFENYRPLVNTVDKSGYGYLWWHKTYSVNNNKIKSIEARGNGGQYIFVVPKLDMVCVITAGNYRNGKTKQPETIFKDYILPSVYSN